MQLRDLHPVILAGGLGTRLRRVLADVPKPMADVSGRPFIEWVIRYLQGQGCDRVSLSIGYRAEVFEDFFRGQPVPGIHVDCVRESEPLGTAGGYLRTARQILANHVGQAFQPDVRLESLTYPAGWLVMNGDSLVLADLPAMVADWQRQGTPAAILARHVADANRYGTLDVTDSDRLARFTEKVAEPKSGWINAGVYFFKQEMLDRFPTRTGSLSFEYDVFPEWLREDWPIAVLKSTAAFLDIGTEETLGRAAEFIEQNKSCF